MHQSLHCRTWEGRSFLKHGAVRQNHFCDSFHILENFCFSDHSPLCLIVRMKISSVTNRRLWHGLKIAPLFGTDEKLLVGNVVRESTESESSDMNARDSLTWIKSIVTQIADVLRKTHKKNPIPTCWEATKNVREIPKLKQRKMCVWKQLQRSVSENDRARIHAKFQQCRKEF